MGGATAGRSSGAGWDRRVERGGGAGPPGGVGRRGGPPEAVVSGWVECVPNFSEGRDEGVLRAIEAAFTSVAGAHLLDVHADASHHRSVFTVAGTLGAVSEAAFRAVRVAVERIDLTQHTGEHPRMGAADVVPLVPLDGVTVQECVDVATQLAERIGAELDVPVFLYGTAATAEERRLLPNLRRGEFEGLRTTLGRTVAQTTDYGPNRIHPTAGATAVGVRSFLVAYNVFLESGDRSLAERIARQVRTSSGGPPGMQAKGFQVDGRAQVSMNLFDLAVTTPVRAFAAVTAAAAELGVGVAESEVVGLLPERAIDAAREAELRLRSPLREYLLEPKLRELGLRI